MQFLPQIARFKIVLITSKGDLRQLLSNKGSQNISW